MQKIGALAPSPGKLMSGYSGPSQADLAFATTMAVRLFGSYPNAKAHDPEVFTGQVVRLFMQYEQEVVAWVVDELPGRKTDKWDGLPSFAKIKELLDERATRVAIDREVAERRERQLREREAEEALRDQQRATGEAERISAGFDDLRTTLRSSLTATDRAIAEQRRDRLTEVNRRVFERECLAAGVDPAGGISPTLRAKVAEWRASEQHGEAAE